MRIMITWRKVNLFLCILQHTKHFNNQTFKISYNSKADKCVSLVIWSNSDTSISSFIKLSFSVPGRSLRPLRTSTACKCQKPSRIFSNVLKLVLYTRAPRDVVLYMLSRCLSTSPMSLRHLRRDRYCLFVNLPTTLEKSPFTPEYAIFSILAIRGSDNTSKIWKVVGQT